MARLKAPATPPGKPTNSLPPPRSITLVPEGRTVIMKPPTDPKDAEPAGPRLRVMWVSAWCFTALFAVWLMFGVLGLEVKKDTALMLGADAAASMSPAEAKIAVQSRFEWLLAVAILAGSLPRLN